MAKDRYLLPNIIALRLKNINIIYFNRTVNTLGPVKILMAVTNSIGLNS